LQYEVDGISCSDIQLIGDDCTTFETAVENGRIALACAIIFPVLKLLVLRYTYANQHNRLLWFFQLPCFAGDVFFGAMAFAAVGDFRFILSSLPAYGDGADTGYGWSLEMFSGFLAFFCAFLAAVVFINRTGEDIHEKIFVPPVVKTLRERFDDMNDAIAAWFKDRVLGCPTRYKRERIAAAERKRKEEEHQEELKTRDTRNIYWGTDGNIWTGRSIINRDEELLDLIEKDTYDESDKTSLWVIMPSRWLRRWLLFCKFKQGEEPGKITMMSLLVKDSAESTGYRAKNTLKPPNYTQIEDPTADDHPGHYRRVTLEVWLKFLEIYGSDGPALAVLGIPYDELVRWSVFMDPKSISSVGMSPPVVIAELETDDSALGSVTAALGGLGGALGGMFGGGGDKKK
jgi:hypothetical protein